MSAGARCCHAARNATRQHRAAIYLRTGNVTFFQTRQPTVIELVYVCMRQRYRSIVISSVA